MTECDRETSVPDWLIEHPEILPTIQRLRIDYSCGGKSLEYACDERGLDVNAVLDSFRKTIKANQKADFQDRNSKQMED